MYAAEACLGTLVVWASTIHNSILRGHIPFYYPKFYCQFPLSSKDYDQLSLPRRSHVLVH